MIEDFAIPNDVWEAALTVSNYAKMQGWSDNWCIADVCSRETMNALNKEIKQWKADFYMQKGRMSKLEDIVTELKQLLS